MLKDKKMFKEILEKINLVNEYGILANGEYFSLDLGHSKYNNLTNLKIKGEKILNNIPSISELKSEYKENSHSILEKEYKKIFKYKIR